jgi:Uma2 family endonuclease
LVSNRIHFGYHDPSENGKAVPDMATASYRTQRDDSNDKIPPLETGDRLSRAEFERRYEAMPNIKKAELIEGVVYIAPPGRLHHYGEPCADLITWLGSYESATPGLIGAAHPSIRLDPKNEPQPEAVLLIDPDHGGQARISSDDFLEAAPELIAEVDSGDLCYGPSVKLDVYCRNGVCEYILWRVPDRQIEWLLRQGGQYFRLPLDETGLYRSTIFPGLWLDPAALMRGDGAAIQAALQRGLSSPGHATFVAKLNAKPKP